MERDRVLTITLISSVVVLVLLLFTGFMAYQSSQTLDEVHLLVNSRFSELLDKNEALMEKVEELGGPKAPPKRDGRGL